MGNLTEFQEGQKLLIDIFKHITTLNTGAILLMATLIKYVFGSDAKCLNVLPFSFGAFVVSTLFCIITMTLLSHSVLEGSKASDNLQGLGFLSVFISFGGFLLGLLLLSYFASVNFN